MQTFRAEALQKFFRAEKIAPFRAEGGDEGRARPLR